MREVRVFLIPVFSPFFRRDDIPKFRIRYWMIIVLFLKSIPVLSQTVTA